MKERAGRARGEPAAPHMLAEGLHAARPAGAGRTNGTRPPESAADVWRSVDALVAVPADAASFVHWGLSGPGPPSAGKGHAYDAALALLFVSYGYFFAKWFIALGMAFGRAGTALFTCYMAIVAAFMVSANRDRRATLVRPHSCLSGLLCASITPEAANVLSKAANRNRKMVKGGVVRGQIINGLIICASYASREGGFGYDEIAAACIMTLLSPVLVFGMYAGGFLEELACRVAIDRVQALTHRVRCSTPATTDFHSLLQDVADAHCLVARTAKELERGTKLNAVSGACGIAFFFFCGLGGVQPRQDSGWYTYRVNLLMCFAGSSILFLTIWGWMQMAKVTSACEELGEAINDQRIGRTSSDTQAHVDIIMPTNDEILRIEHVHSYLRNLNRGRGMGFVIGRKRISYSFVLSMAIKAASAMVFLFPIMLSFTQVEKGEDSNTNNATGGVCVCEQQ